MEQNIWTLEKYPDELNHVFKLVKNNQNFELYTNLLGELKVGNKLFKTSQFHTALEIKDGYILFSKDDLVTKKDILSKFSKLNFHINYLADELELDDSDFTLDFIHTIKKLEQNIINSLEMGNNDCDFYPYIGGEFSLKLNKKISQQYRGLIQINDKLLLLMNQKGLPQISLDDVFKLMKKYNMDCHYYECGEPNLSHLSKRI